MYLSPQLKVASRPIDNFITSFQTVIENIACSPYFIDHLEKSQIEQRQMVSNFQQEVYQKLKISFNHISWSLEHSPAIERSDAIDIYGKCKEFIVIIELDKHRADQVAKKFVSRMALIPDSKIYYTAICYPGTKKMNKTECLKYFDYCNLLAEKMGSKFMGFIVEEPAS